MFKKNIYLFGQFLLACLMCDIPEYSQSEISNETDGQETLQPVKGDPEIPPQWEVTTCERLLKKFLLVGK